MGSSELGNRPARIFSPGATLGSRYMLERNIGTGGYSEVWAARDAVLDRQVAIKLLYAEHARSADTLLRFRTEAQLAAQLSDANVAMVYDFRDAANDGAPYLVMEYIDGPTLADVLRSGPLEPAWAMEIVAQAASGLQAAHAAGMVHRDIKPSNIMLAPGKVVKITDFGLSHTLASAPITRTGMVAGTPGFMAPERAAGVRATAASDLYALGVVGYECLAGAPPFEGTPIEVALAHRDCAFPPLPASTPAPVAELIAHLTAKDPADRPASAGLVAVAAAELRDALMKVPPARGTVTARLTELAGPAHHTLIVPVPQAEYEPAAARARRGPTAAIAWILAAALGVAAVVAIAALAHRGGPPATGTRPPGTSAVRTVDVNPGALVGEQVGLAYRQLRSEGFRVRIAWKPTRQPLGSVLAVRPAGMQPVGSLITLVAAIRPLHGHHQDQGGGDGGQGGGGN